MSKTSLATLLFSVAPLFAQNPSFITFAAPDAGNSDTWVTCINGKGAIAGYYYDKDHFTHGFVRDPNGTITEFTPHNFYQVVPVGINNRRQIAGTGSTFETGLKAFTRMANGQIIIINPPGSFEPYVTGINDNGQIIGGYRDRMDTNHAFLRDESGVYTVIDEPNAETGVNLGSDATAINRKGEVTGIYYDKSTGVPRGFIRDQVGNFTTFDGVPGGSAILGTAGINSAGEVTGFFSGTNGASEPFLRDASGNVVDFVVPNSTTSMAYGINDSGMILGGAADAETSWGFLRDASGTLTSFFIPIENRGFTPVALNKAGRITGNYRDRNGVSRGFVR